MSAFLMSLWLTVNPAPVADQPVTTGGKIRIQPTGGKIRIKPMGGKIRI